MEGAVVEIPLYHDISPVLRQRNRAPVLSTGDTPRAGRSVTHLHEISPLQHRKVVGRSGTVHVPPPDPAPGVAKTNPRSERWWAIALLRHREGRTEARPVPAAVGTAGTGADQNGAIS